MESTELSWQSVLPQLQRGRHTAQQAHLVKQFSWRETVPHSVMGRNQAEGCDEDHEDSTFFSPGEHLLSRREGPEGSLYLSFKIRGRHSVYALLISLTSMLRAMFRKKSPVQIIFKRYHGNLKRVARESRFPSNQRQPYPALR